jgi:preprotein translocase subunit SecY
MDDVMNKWGVGSGISLFIAAGVAKTLFIRGLSPMRDSFSGGYIGAVPEMFRAIADQDLQTAALKAAAIASTLLIFGVVVYVQSMKVEIPLSFARIRGHGMRWPLNFLYTSNIPVILIAALLANLQLWVQMAEKWSGSSFSAQSLLAWVQAPGGQSGLLGVMIQQGFGNINPMIFLQSIV